MKTRYSLPIFIVALLILGAGCGGDDAGRSKTGDVQASPAGTAPAATKHAAAGVQPGSHDDWCGEHQVPESLCTRCNPALIPAFKATHDWCAEHGLPESQCLICNPDVKIARPPEKDGAK